MSFFLKKTNNVIVQIIHSDFYFYIHVLVELFNIIYKKNHLKLFLLEACHMKNIYFSSDFALKSYESFLNTVLHSLMMLT